jgi:hypothetical protein
LDYFPHSYTIKNHELDYVTKALESTSKTQDAHARKAAGIKDPRFVVRLTKRLQHAQLGMHAHKPGPPSKYTDDVFEKALDVCREHAVINQHELLRQLIDAGVLAEPVSVQRFWNMFKLWARRHGHRCSMTYGGIEFEITETNAHERQQFCDKWLQHLRAGVVRLSDIYYMDVTTLLKNPHPKSMCNCFGACLCITSAWACMLCMQLAVSCNDMRMHGTYVHMHTHNFHALSMQVEPGAGCMSMCLVSRHRARSHQPLGSIQ